jgi:hypothetical protein
MEWKLQRSYVGVRGQENTMCRHAYRKASVKPLSWSCLARHELEIISFYLPQILRLPVLPV